MSISLIVNCDDLEPARVHKQGDVAWVSFLLFSLYGCDALALRRLAASLNEAADLLTSKAATKEVA